MTWVLGVSSWAVSEPHLAVSGSSRQRAGAQRGRKDRDRRVRRRPPPAVPGGSARTEGAIGGAGPGLEYIGSEVAAGLLDVVLHGVPCAFGVPGLDGVEHRAMVRDRVSTNVA